MSLACDENPVHEHLLLGGICVRPTLPWGLNVRAPVQAGGSVTAGYKATFRRLVANLREASNPDLRRRVLAREITGMPFSVHRVSAA